MSVSIGIGPVCRRRQGGGGKIRRRRQTADKENGIHLLADDAKLGPKQNNGFAALWRRSNGFGLGEAVVEGVPFSNWRKHSPTGFNWGYPGSGPSALAADILIQCGIQPTVKQVSEHYQTLKWDLIADLPVVGPFVVADFHGGKFVFKTDAAAAKIIADKKQNPKSIIIEFAAIRKWLESRPE